MFFLTINIAGAQQKMYMLTSPDKKTEIKIAVDDKIHFSISHKGNEILSPSTVSLHLENGKILGTNPIVKDVKTNSVSEEIRPVVPEKRKIVPNIYNETELLFKDNFKIQFRAYNDGVAYRFVTDLPGGIIIKNEEVGLNFSPQDSVYFPQEDSFLMLRFRRPKLVNILNPFQFLVLCT